MPPHLFAVTRPDAVRGRERERELCGLRFVGGAPCGRVDGGRHWHPLHPSAQASAVGSARGFSTAGHHLGEPLRQQGHSQSVRLVAPQPPTSPSSLRFHRSNGLYVCTAPATSPRHSRVWPARAHLCPGWNCSGLAPLAHRVRPGTGRPHDDSRTHPKLGSEENAYCSMHLTAPSPSRDFT